MSEVVSEMLVCLHTLPELPTGYDSASISVGLDFGLVWL